MKGFPRIAFIERGRSGRQLLCGDSLSPDFSQLRMTLNAGRFLGARYPMSHERTSDRLNLISSSVFVVDPV